MKANALPRQCIVAGFVQATDAEGAFRALDRLSQRVTKSLVAEPSQVRSTLRRLMPVADRSLMTARRGLVLGALIGLAGGVLVGVVFDQAGNQDTIPQVLITMGLIAAGLVVGALMGAMSGWERPSDHVDRYERAVQEGYVLVVASAEPDALIGAYEVLQEASPQLLDRHATTADDLEGAPSPVP